VIGGGQKGAIGRFAKAHGLQFTESIELPRQGELLSRTNLRMAGVATGKLPGGEEGTLAHLSYTEKSGDSTRTRELTAVVTRVPETIGFAPYLASGNRYKLGAETHSIRLPGNAGTMTADNGIDASWLAELLSPALADWLSRNPEGFEFELSNGVLCVSQDRYLQPPRELRSLCEDAAHLARALRSEALEEVETGGERRTAAKAGQRERIRQKLIESLLPLVSFAEPPANVSEAKNAFHSAVSRRPGPYLKGTLRGIAYAIGVNVIGGGIFGLLLNLPRPGIAVIVFEVLVLAITVPKGIRTVIENRASWCGVEAFYRSYAAQRKLRFEDPLPFAAAHARAHLPGKPDRVMSGTLPGGTDGSLVLSGDGSKRDDWIALVSAKGGPAAITELDAPAPGVSSKLLDEYCELLAQDLQR
jgi:hypothetical protein